ncbi:conserved hypothetical protein [Anaeromyxobacter dehalogenans 2CP-1]|uniref:PatA-like N-terminal domain-containing protein n=1 Tax=Anaeromyxobacter dehalogenans (strain ATCC BAA-258 / DSM 21875 / 2CP-1) TaxID=455488 RepID=B8JEU7_ANAD2|nr:DUF4388 domain-containing protein [Anaeromyxobacter dehalogenans]ACL66243.1 conserved hypothetical protein [Anaeromyxobacter dehalogenans 2CP-1]
MALTGTLKDFGIAEILQLIGQQAKSGVLHLESRDDEIHIALADGNVVRAESAGRKARERLGNMLVRAEVISKEELEQGLEVQKRTLRRLGDILVELGFVSQQDLREMTALQTTETVYQLFRWKSGTYAFEPGEVEWDRETVSPLRAESVLMEGFRRVDEWPMIRKRIPSTAMTFERRRALDPDAPAAPRRGGDDVDDAFDALGEEPTERRGEFASLGANERRVFALAIPGRTVERLVDLSRLGEFETCKALTNLLNLGYLEAVAPASRAKAAVGAYAQDWQARLRAGALSVLATVAIAAALAGIAYWVDERGLAWGEPAGAARVRDNAAERFLARYQLERLRGALEVYRLEKGEYPAALGTLVEAGLVDARDLRHPWAEPYHYRRTQAGRFVLLPPVE